MKTKLFLLFAIMIYGNTFSQWTEHIISTDIGQCGSIYTADFNGDEYMDVLSVCGDFIDWWENDGTSEGFTRHPISTDIDRAYQVYAFDIDYDGDMDVLYTSRDDNKLAWHENTDGLGNFGPQQLITALANTDGARFLDVADLDGDELADVLSASAYDNKIAWYKNLGNGDFGDINTNQNIISDEEIHAISVHAVDIDGDGDFDVAAASYVGDEIFWFENLEISSGTFGPKRIIDTNRDAAASVSSGDFDGDGDMDLVSVSDFDHTIKWYENIDGAGTFDNHLITDEAWSVVFVYATDIDDDGDPDFLAALANVDKVVAYVNDGEGNFTECIVTSNADFVVSVHAADINSDGRIDVLSASVNDNKIAWYDNENEKCILSVNENTLVDFSVYPNPVSELLTISISENVLFEKAVVYSVKGERLLETSEKSIHVSGLSTGLYFIELSVEGKRITKKFIKE